MVTQEFHKKQKIENEQEALIDLTISNSSTIPMTDGDGPRDTYQVDPRIQVRKELRLNEIQKWIEEEMNTFLKLNKDVCENAEELRNAFKMEVTQANRERCIKKNEMLNQMMIETVKTKGKLY